MSANTLSSPRGHWAATVFLVTGLAQAASADSTNAVSRYEGPARLTGTIYSKEANPRKALYQFRREAVRSGARVNVLREFTYPDGKPAARERFVYQGDNLVRY